LLQTANQTFGLVDQGVKSTTAWLAALGLAELPLRYPAILVASDGEGHVLSNIMPRYKKSARAIPASGVGPIKVNVGIQRAFLKGFDLKNGEFEAEFWFQQRWQDTRLSWSTLQFNSTLLIDHQDLWNPDVYLANLGAVRHVIYEPKAIVDHVGMIEKTGMITGHFNCVLRVAPYPFSVHTCAVNVGAAESSGVELSAELGMSLAGVTEGFYKPTVVSTEVVGGVAHFTFEIIQKTEYALVCFAFPAYILNVVSFSAFYLPGRDDRTGLGVTSVLAQMVLQVEARIGLVFTWLDVLLALSFVFQFVAFVVSLVARRTASQLQHLDSETQLQHLDSDDEGLHDVTHLRRLRSLGTTTMRGNLISLGRWTLATNRLDRLAGLVFGGEGTFPEDRFARCYVVPLYLICMMVLSFYPSSGRMDITLHPDHGLRLWLFWLNNLFLLPIVLASAYELKKKLTKLLMSEKGETAATKQEPSEEDGNICGSDPSSVQPEGIGTVEHGDFESGGESTQPAEDSIHLSAQKAAPPTRKQACSQLWSLGEDSIHALHVNDAETLDEGELGQCRRRAVIEV
jgi:hypothetical protein